MSFESVYKTSSGLQEINKITNFISSLSIKNQYDADAYETNDSRINYENNYYRPYNRVDSFFDYSLSLLRKINQSAKEHGGAYAIDDSYLIGTEQSVQFILNDLYENGDETIVNFLEYCRSYKIVTYEELNRYYSQYGGYPIDETQIILVRNFDTPDPDDVIPIHQITAINTPDTYRNMFVINSMEDNEFGYGIDYYRSLHPDYIYLRFIDKRPLYLKYKKPSDLDTVIDYSVLRSAKNYTIFNWDDTILNESEFRTFLKSYSKAKLLVNREYLKTFDERFPRYNVLEMINLLRYTTLFYFNGYLERYSIHDFTLDNIYDILDSLNMSKLKQISDKNKLFKLIKIIDDIIINKGSENNLLRIVTDILGEDPETVRGCYIRKKYNTDTSGEINIDLNNYTVPELVIHETSLFKSSNLDDIYHDYDDFVSTDNLWGGAHDEFSIVNSDLKAKLKKEILTKNIDNVQTKYLIFRKVVNLLKTNVRQIDVLGMIVKYYNTKFGAGMENNPLLVQSLTVDDIVVSPGDLFALLCYTYNVLNYKPNPQRITNNDTGERIDEDVPKSQYSSINKFYSEVFGDPADRHAEIVELLNKPIKRKDNSLVYIADDETNGLLIRDVLLYYSIIWDMFIPGRTGESNDYVFSMIMKQLGLTDPNVFNNVDKAFEYIKTLYPKIYQIVSHLYTNYSGLGTLTSDNLLDECVSRYKYGEYPIGYTRKCNDLYIYDQSKLKLPVCRDNELDIDVISQYNERKYRSDKQTQYISWNFLRNNNYEDPDIVGSFMNVFKGDGVYKYDDIFQYFSENNSVIMSYLIRNKLIKYSGGNYIPYNLLTEKDTDRKVVVERFVEYEAKFKEILRTWIQEQTIHTIISSIDQLSDQNYVNDIKLLVEEFVSIFKELKNITYDVDTNIKYSNVISICSDNPKITLSFTDRQTNEMVYDLATKIDYKSNGGNMGITYYDYRSTVSFKDDDEDIIYDDPKYKNNSYRVHKIEAINITSASTEDIDEGVYIHETNNN